MINSTFKKEDAEVLLKDVKNEVEIVDISKPQNINSNLHYCDFIPVEKPMDPAYEVIFNKMLKLTEEQTAFYVGKLTKMVCEKYSDVVFVSLLRAGTVIGVLMKRYAMKVLNKDIKHYSVGLSRGKGIDFNALKYIIRDNPHKTIIFIDGWVGKGTTKMELDRTCNLFNKKYGTHVEPIIAVLSDLKNISDFCATSKDILLPNSLINAQGCGLISRITQNEQIIRENEYNGAIIFDDLKEEDKTYILIDSISKYFGKTEDKSPLIDEPKSSIVLDSIIDKYKIQNINGIKAGINETIRILLKRNVSFVLVKNINNLKLEPIKYLCDIKKIEIREDGTLPCESMAIILNHQGDE